MESDFIFREASRLFSTDTSFNLEEIVRETVSFGSETPDEIKTLNRWIRNHSDIYKMDTVILFHGTSSSHDITEQGIKKTTLKSKRSLQSSPGFVYLSIYPGMAKTFGQMTYPLTDISVYAVKVPVKDLKADLDQLKNKRMWGNLPHLGNSIAESLVYGSGARVKRDIHDYEVRDITNLLKASEEHTNMEFAV